MIKGYVLALCHLCYSHAVVVLVATNDVMSGALSWEFAIVHTAFRERIQICGCEKGTDATPV